MSQLLNFLPPAICLLFTIYAIARVRRHLIYVWARRFNGCEDPPKYPHKDPIWGLDLFYSQKRAGEKGTLLATSKRLFQENGKTYEVSILGQRIIHTMDAKNIQTAWANSWKDWGLQPIREGLAVPFFDKGINTTDGEYWQHSRSLIRPTFSRIEVANLKSLEKHTDRFLTRLPRDGSTIDLQGLFSCLFLDVSTEFLFGESMDSLLPKTPIDSDLFIKSFDYARIGLGRRIRLGRFRFLHRDKKWHEAIRIVHAQVDRYIGRAVQQQQEKQAQACDQSLDPGAQHRYVLLNEMAKQTQDKVDLRSQILAVFMPGRDSTGYALSNIFHALARHPGIYQKLRDEVSCFQDQPITFEMLKSMKYTQWVINEGHRVHPTAAQTIRACLRDTILPTGGGPTGNSPIFVQKGDHLIASMWSLHQDEDIWGADAADFRPERWKGLKPMWTYIPFMGGPRTCPAQQMVLTQEAYVLIRIVREFARIENRDENAWTEASRVAFMSKYGVKVGLVPV